jgi:hypothetical protein
MVGQIIFGLPWCHRLDEAQNYESLSAPGDDEPRNRAYNGESEIITIAPSTGEVR